MIDCRTAVDKLYGYLDRELSPEETQAIQEHLAACPPCARYFRFEQGVLRFVGDACRKTTAPSALKSRVAELCAERSRERESSPRNS